MINLLKLCAIGLLAGAASFSQALELRPYSASAFAEAQNSGKPFAVLFHADWCPTCRAQEKTLKSMKGEGGLDLTGTLSGSGRALSTASMGGPGAPSQNVIGPHGNGP